MRVGGRLQMTKMCVFCWLSHSNGRRETEGEKGGGGEFDDAKWEKEGGGRRGRTGGRTPTPSELIPSELQPVGRRIRPDNIHHLPATPTNTHLHPTPTHQHSPTLMISHQLPPTTKNPTHTRQHQPSHQCPTTPNNNNRCHTVHLDKREHHHHQARHPPHPHHPHAYHHPQAQQTTQANHCHPMVSPTLPDNNRQRPLPQNHTRRTHTGPHTPTTHQTTTTNPDNAKQTHTQYQPTPNNSQ